MRRPPVRALTCAEYKLQWTALFSSSSYLVCFRVHPSSGLERTSTQRLHAKGGDEDRRGNGKDDETERSRGVGGKRGCA